MRTMLLVLGLLATTPAVAADQFDLVCKGQQRILPAQRWKPYEVRYRVDLAQMVYCRFGCRTTETIAAADAARITFQVAGNGRTASYLVHQVDRSTGAWSYYLGGDSETKGVCEPAPFTGFPAAKF